MSELKKNQDRFQSMMVEFEMERGRLEEWIKNKMGDENKVFLNSHMTFDSDGSNTTLISVANISQIAYSRDTGSNMPITQVILDASSKVIEIISKTIVYRDRIIHYYPHLDYSGESDHIYDYFKLFQDLYISSITKDFDITIKKINTSSSNKNEDKIKIENLIKSLNIPSNFMEWTDEHLVMLRLAYQ